MRCCAAFWSSGYMLLGLIRCGVGGTGRGGGEHDRSVELRRKATLDMWGKGSSISLHLLMGGRCSPSDVTAVKNWKVHARFVLSKARWRPEARKETYTERGLVVLPPSRSLPAHCLSQGHAKSLDFANLTSLLHTRQKPEFYPTRTP